MHNSILIFICILFACFISKSTQDCQADTDCVVGQVCVNANHNVGKCFCLVGSSFVNGTCVSQNTGGDSTSSSSSGSSPTGSQKGAVHVSNTHNSNSANNDPTLIRHTNAKGPDDNTHSTPCSNLLQDKVCFNNGTCFTVDGQKNWCTCPGDFAGANCQIKNPRGTAPTKTIHDVTVQDNSRYINQAAPDGSIWARHVVKNIDECAIQCQKEGSCHSINYGSVNGNNICETLSVTMTDDNPLLKTWVKSANGWKFASNF